MDRLTIIRRGVLMSKIRSTDTGPERQVRSLLHKMGYRFRLHRGGLPGTPDIVFPSRMKAIFVNGCFWHAHKLCKKATLPKSNVHYWIPKLEANANRDTKNIAALKALGWRVLVLWECELPKRSLEAKLSRFLS
ncbi:MAG: very short patch repair endonuclease [Proteobacteria bacterium]|nr:very short patch repair endonuclease [Pseudomonadota bacterium]